ncbi:MAG: sulfatase-like hydrolase/transferase [Treponema sp.]|nr:sulfatase-like hydrolase/transferase [Treponema sp.]
MEKKKRPNILWITTDHLQGVFLYPDSECILPNLKKLISEGMHFPRTYTPMPVCCPVRAMWVTGSYPWLNGMFTQNHSDPSITRDMYPNVESYAKNLCEAGYKVGFNGKWHASRLRSPLDFGYEEMGHFNAVNQDYLKPQDYTHIRPQPKSKNTLRLTPVKNFKWPGSDPFMCWGYYEGDMDDLPTHRLAASVIEMIKAYSKDDKPWHITAHFPEPHDPYTPHKHYLDLYKDVHINLPKSYYDSFEGKPGMHRRESGIWGDITPEDVIESRRYYYAFCTQIDDQIGRILTTLKETGLEDDTIIMFTADHGDMLGAHRMWSKSWMPYEEVWKVPGVVKYPGVVPAGVVCDKLIMTHYMPYTFLDYAGAAPLKSNHGHSLRPLFENPCDDSWENIAFCAGYGCEFFVTQRMVINGRFKYMFNGFDFDEMYDLENDPDEMKNIIDDPVFKEERSILRGKIYEMMARYKDPYGDVSPYGDVHGNRPNRYGAPRYLPRQ